MSNIMKGVPFWAFPIVSIVVWTGMFEHECDAEMQLNDLQ